MAFALPTHEAKSARRRKPDGFGVAPARPAPTPFPLIQRKSSCACGGGCPRCTAKSSLPVSQPGDAAELEADCLAEQVMRSPAPAPSVEQQPWPAVQRASATAPPSTAPASVNKTLRGTGQPLNKATREFFEPRFGSDLGQVRIYTGPEADASARDVSALAYTVGNRIVFAHGQYSPDTSAGQKLLAHELAHVQQQNAGIFRAPDGDSPSCHKKPYEGYGENVKPPLEFEGLEYIYAFWGQWQNGDTVDSVSKRTIPKWIAWRFSGITAAQKEAVANFLQNTNSLPAGSNFIPGCYYAIGLEKGVYARARVLSGEVAREKAAQQAKQEAAEKAKQEAQEQVPSGGPAANEGEVKGATAAVIPGDANKTPPASATGEKKPDAPKSGGGLGELAGPVEQSKKADLMPTAKLAKDWSSLKDSALASHYLKVLEHFAGRSISEKDKTAAADGLTQEELETIIAQQPLRRILTSLYAQGYAEFKAAGGSDNEAFFKLEELIAEQFTRGNPTATHNQLKIGKGFPEKDILGIVVRSSEMLYYNAEGIPLGGIGGVGFRDKGYIASRKEDKWGFNIANIEDEGIKALLNSLRQTFGDPLRMAAGGAKVYFNNIELVNARVQKNLGPEVWKKLQDMAPYFIGFLAGHALSTFLMRVPNPTVAGVGLALKGLLAAAEYVMQIEFGAGAIERLMAAASHLSHVEKNDKNEITQLSEEHLAKASALIRDMVAEIAALFATMALGKLLRMAKSGEKQLKIECTHCDITGGPAKEAKAAEGKSQAPEAKAKAKTPEPPDAARKKEILELFAEEQGKLTREEVQGDVKSQPGMSEAPKPGGKKAPEAFDIGNFSHKYAEQLIPESKLPRGLEAEFKIPEANKRCDRIDWQNGKVYEIKPDTPSQVKAGSKQVELYVNYLNEHYPLPNGKKWSGEVVTYPKAAVRALLKFWGWLE